MFVLVVLYGCLWSKARRYIYEKYGVSVPLVLMTSFRTEASTRAVPFQLRCVSHCNNVANELFVEHTNLVVLFTIYLVHQQVCRVTD